MRPLLWVGHQQYNEGSPSFERMFKGKWPNFWSSTLQHYDLDREAAGKLLRASAC